MTESSRIMRNDCISGFSWSMNLVRQRVRSTIQYETAPSALNRRRSAASVSTYPGLFQLVRVHAAPPCDLSHTE